MRLNNPFCNPKPGRLAYKIQVQIVRFITLAHSLMLKHVNFSNPSRIAVCRVAEAAPPFTKTENFSHPFFNTNHLYKISGAFIRTLKSTPCIHPQSPETRRKGEEKRTMRTPIPLSLTIILSLLLISSIAEASILEETCKGVTAARPNIGYEFCVTSLGVDPGSSSADTHGLAVIATRLSLANATDTESNIDQLMVVESKPSLKDCLGVCSEVYSDAIDHLNDAIRNLEARLYREAVTFLSAALDAPDNCEDAFRDAGDVLPSPLAREDEDYGRLADIALTITASLG